MKIKEFDIRVTKKQTVVKIDFFNISWSETLERVYFHLMIAFAMIVSKLIMHEMQISIREKKDEK